MIQIVTTDEQKATLPYAPKTAGGKDAEVDSVDFEITEGDATVVVDEENKKVSWVSGTAGVTKGKIIMDADLGEGIVPIEEDFEYFVTAAQASNLGFGEAVVELK